MFFSPINQLIKSLYPDKNPVVLHEPQFLGNERKYVMDCIDSTFVSSVGAYVGRFEEGVARFLEGRGPRFRGDDKSMGDGTEGGGPRFRGDDKSADDGTEGGGPRFRGDDKSMGVHCVAAVNGTAALHLALQVAGVKPGDRVITQPLTFIATVNAIKYAGAEPVFVDVDRDTLGMSPVALDEYLAEAVTRHASRVTAIVPMHTFGLACRIEEIVQVANKYGIPVIEDAAESIGTWYHGQHTGTFGEIGTLSFNGNKTITTGGGGMLVTRDTECAKRLKHLTTQAKIPHPWEFAHDETAYNYRMPNLNAAMGVAQLEMLPRFLEAKRKLHTQYTEFCNAHGIEIIHELPGTVSNYWLNAILLKDRKERDAFLQYNYDNGVHCRPAWELMHHLTMFDHCERGELGNAEWIGERLVNLPSSPVVE